MQQILASSRLLFLTVPATEGDATLTFKGVPSEVIELTREGFGAASKGGEGGKVIWVTNLNSEGQGSFHEAYKAKGPRIIRFKVGGTIEHDHVLQTESGRVTIDGLSAAPYGGITIKGGLRFARCEDVIVRHIRSRHALGAGGDCISLSFCKRVLIDHVSMSWATDETFDTLESEDVTFQWCIAAEALLRSNHPKGGHSCGCLLTGRNITMHHCLSCGNWGRNPLWGVEYRVESGRKQLEQYNKTGKHIPWYFDFVNNTFYNYGHSGQVYGGVFTNFVGNYYRPGPDTPGSHDSILVLTKGCTNYRDFPEPKIFCRDNIGRHRPNNQTDEFQILRFSTGDGVGVLGLAKPELKRLISRNPFKTAPVTTQPVMAAYERVLEFVGAFPRDNTDQRLIDEVREKTGKLGAMGKP